MPDLHFLRSDYAALRGCVLSIGTFDGVHLGHQMILKQVCDATRAANTRSVIITFHPHPRKLLHPGEKSRLLTPLPEKIELIKQQGIDEVIVIPFTEDFSRLSAADYIEHFLVGAFHPARLVIGYDHRFGSDRAGNIETLREYSGRYSYAVTELNAHLIDNAAVSSTGIRNALQAGLPEEAASLLGRPYSVSGTVVAGRQLGRTIGFATANINPDDADQLMPANGVYAGLARVQGKTWPAMINIGVRPTVAAGQAVLMEVHLIHADADLYGQSMSVSFLHRLRDEQKFETLQLLQAQLETDRTDALARLRQ